MKKNFFLSTACLTLCIGAALLSGSAAQAQEMGTLSYYGIPESEYRDHHHEWQVFLEYNLQREPCQHYQVPPAGYVMKQCRISRLPEATPVVSPKKIKETKLKPPPQKAPPAAPTVSPKKIKEPKMEPQKAHPQAVVAPTIIPEKIRETKSKQQKISYGVFLKNAQAALANPAEQKQLGLSDGDLAGTKYLIEYSALAIDLIDHLNDPDIEVNEKAYLKYFNTEQDMKTSLPQLERLLVKLGRPSGNK